MHSHRFLPTAAAAFVLFAMARPAAAETICTILVDARTGAGIVEEGDCARRATPASTFKIALALMGYDAGFLKSVEEPALPFREGYPDWIDTWRQTTGPSAWMKNSVVWFSQRITEALGPQRFADYVAAFRYGNADVRGDPGKDNGLQRSWIGSSLEISPREQVAFLRNLLGRRLGVSESASVMTERLTTLGEIGKGWRLNGKTGAAYPRRADGSQDRDRPFGWFVGWATRGDRQVVFARLVQDRRKTPGSPGIRTRDAMREELPALLDRP